MPTYTDREIEFAQVWGKFRTREDTVNEMNERETVYGFCPVCAHGPVKKPVGPAFRDTLGIRHSDSCPRRNKGAEPKMLAIVDLRLGDVVQLFEGPWGTAIVRKIVPVESGADAVHLDRPYGVSADFSTTGGVITYTGHENVTYFTDSSAFLLVYERKTLA